MYLAHGRTKGQSKLYSRSSFVIKYQQENELHRRLPCINRQAEIRNHKVDVLQKKQLIPHYFFINLTGIYEKTFI